MVTVQVGTYVSGPIVQMLCDFNTQVKKKRQQPIARFRVVVTGQNPTDSLRVVRTRRKIGADKKNIARTNQRRQPGCDVVRLEIRNHSEKSDDPRRISLLQPIQHGGQIVCRGQIAQQRVARRSLNGAPSLFRGSQDKPQAHIARRVSKLPSLFRQQCQQPRFLLSAPTPQPDHPHAAIRKKSASRRVAAIINGGAIRIGPGR